MKKKLLKSDCKKAWLFNVKQEDDVLVAGLACFTHGCPMEVAIMINGKKRMAIVPARAINSPVPLRMLNARLPLLPLTNDE